MKIIRFPDYLVNSGMNNNIPAIDKIRNCHHIFDDNEDIFYCVFCGFCVERKYTNKESKEERKEMYHVK